MDPPLVRRGLTMKNVLPLILVAVVLSACSALSRKGGYYQDDGPPRRARVDVASIPDAVPRIDPLSETGNQPYSVYGTTYFPLKDASGYRERGVASWYGKKFHGRRTSSGEPYDMYAMTAAHKTLPLPSYVQVRNLDNGRTVIVRVNDRGPFLRNRLIDLSYAAAAKLSIVGTGTGLVEVQVVAPQSVSSDTTALAAPQPETMVRAAPVPVPPRLYLQVGAFTSRANAVTLRARLQAAQLGPVVIYSELQDETRLFRVRIGPLQSIKESDRVLQRVLAQGIADAHIVIE
ncbi:MAG: septal ring lytic transglycosylase RlpA family protein [Gammaproteobacteria bacterium]|nr:MAG: septal ring lytic transglycosylase RlpA family protein [Gammaproteobacteria bacterium]